jgi:hypothetical protein
MKFMGWYGILVGTLFGLPLIIWGIWTTFDPGITKGPGITLPFDVMWIPIILITPIILGSVVLLLKR